MQPVEAFIQPIEDIAAFFAGQAEDSRIFVAQSDGNDAFAVLTVIVESADDLGL